LHLRYVINVFEETG